MAADLLPYCRSLAQSARRADRILWLRIAGDVVARLERAEASLGSGWETSFAESLELVGEDVRLEIARRLSGSGRAMSQLADVFLRRPDAAALWMIEHAPGLAEKVRFQALHSPVLSAALARRVDLEPAWTDQLLADGVLTTLIELATNLRLQLTRPQITRLIDRAAACLRISDDERLARALLRRAPMTVDFAPLFLEASSAQRAQILFAAERAALATVRACTIPTLTQDQVGELERHALERQEPQFIEALSHALDCDPVWARRIAQDAFGEPLAVTLAALGAPNDVCVRILTARDMAEGPDYPRLGALGRLQGAPSPVAAWTIVKAMLGDATPRATATTPAPRRTSPAPQVRGGEIAYAHRREKVTRERRSGDAS